MTMAVFSAVLLQRLGLAGIELAADGEEFGAVAPGGEDVLYHCKMH